MSKQILSTYRVILERDTSQTYTLELRAYSEEEATNKALDMAHGDSVQWEESDYLGDTVVSLIEMVKNKRAGKETEEIFNITNQPPQTNIEFVTELMTYSNHGALAQMFVFDALFKFSKLVMETPTEEMSEMDNGIISCSAWKSVASEIHEKLARREV